MHYSLFLLTNARLKCQSRLLLCVPKLFLSPCGENACSIYILCNSFKWLLRRTTGGLLAMLNPFTISMYMARGKSTLCYNVCLKWYFCGIPERFSAFFKQVHIDYRYFHISWSKSCSRCCCALCSIHVVFSYFEIITTCSVQTIYCHTSTWSMQVFTTLHRTDRF